MVGWLSWARTWASVSKRRKARSLARLSRKATLEAATREVEPRTAEGVFRMPVQRVFSLRGIGTVNRNQVLGTIHWGRAQTRTT